MQIFIDISFAKELYNIKLYKQKLECQNINIIGFLSKKYNRIRLSEESFDYCDKNIIEECILGNVRVMNIYEEFEKEEFKESSTDILQLYFYIDFKDNVYHYKYSLIYSGKNYKSEIKKMVIEQSKEKIFKESADLNLSLMKWRFFKELNIPVIKNTKCLIIGAGTLGSAVGRTLLGWGFENITFIDNSKVSASNPLRQCLYNYDDISKNKAECAAESLRKVSPFLNIKGLSFEVPMPGHIIENEENITLLESLVKEHDVIFLLTDNRESRWLPTFFGSLYKKIVMTGALGFSTYLVSSHIPEGSGCYFCNDLVYPVDSTKNRDFDKQCTVTRIGSSYIVAGLLIELLVNILHNKYEVSQIRGSVNDFYFNSQKTSSFDQCMACSKNIQEEYISKGTSFLMNILRNPQILSDINNIKEPDYLEDFGDLNFQKDI